MVSFAPGRIVPALSLALSVTLAQAAPAEARDRSGPVTDMLSRLPLSAVTPERHFEVEYGNPEAARPALLPVSDDPAQARIGGTGRGLPQRVGQFLLMQLEGSRDLVGFEMTEILESAAVTQSPVTMTLYRFAPGIEDRVGPALEALGYVRDDRDGVPVWARGADDETDMAARDAANPFGGVLGRPGRVAVDGALVAWSPRWAPIEGFTGERPGMDSHPHIAALIAALDSPGAGPGDLIAARFTLDPDRTWRSPAVMSADMADGGSAVTLFGIVVPPERDAGTLAADLDRTWHTTPMRSFAGPETFADRFGGTAEVSVVPGAPAIVLIRLSTPQADPMINRAYGQAIALMMRGDLEILLTPPAP